VHAVIGQSLERVQEDHPLGLQRATPKPQAWNGLRLHILRTSVHSASALARITAPFAMPLGIGLAMAAPHTLRHSLAFPHATSRRLAGAGGLVAAGIAAMAFTSRLDGILPVIAPPLSARELFAVPGAGDLAFTRFATFTLAGLL